MGQDFISGFLAPEYYILCFTFNQPASIYVTQDSFWEFACESL
jgi:hypothetical protein